MIKFLIDPFNILLFLLLIAVVARLLNYRSSFKWLLGILAVWFLVISTPVFPNIILHSLENRYVPIDVTKLGDDVRETEYHIVVLGGGHGFDDRLPPNSLLSLQALARLNEGVRLHRELPNSTLVLSGYSSSGRTTQAEMLYQTALLLGVDEGRMLMQKEPANTNEEARAYLELFGNDKPILLVTSAAHMPRSMGAFQNIGLDPIPSPAHFRLIGGPSFKRWWLPSVRNILHFGTAVNEYAAIHRDWWLQ